MQNVWVVGGLLGVSLCLKQDDSKVIDFNKCEFGIYYTGGNGLESTEYFTSTPNAPLGAYRFGTLLSVKCRTVTQIYVPILYSSTGGKIYIRTKAEAGENWQSWKSISLNNLL